MEFSCNTAKDSRHSKMQKDICGNATRKALSSCANMMKILLVEDMKKNTGIAVRIIRDSGLSVSITEKDGTSS